MNTFSCLYETSTISLPMIWLGLSENTVPFKTKILFVFDV